MIANISTAERDGQFLVHIGLDDTKLAPRGPFQNSDEAEAAACQLAAICRAIMHTEVHWGATAGARKRG